MEVIIDKSVDLLSELLFVLFYNFEGTDVMFFASITAKISFFILICFFVMTLIKCTNLKILYL